MFDFTKEREAFENKVWLSSPTMHGPELEYIKEAYETNWMSTVGANINEVEKLACEKVGCKYAVALSAGTAALHMAVKLAGMDAYGMPDVGHGTLEGEKVFCSDMTFDATVNPVVYEGGVPVFIDTEYDTWNMDPVALEKAFAMYPEVKVVVTAHLYGTPGKVDEIRKVCDAHGAILIEDAADMNERVINEFCKIIDPTDRSLLVVFIDTPASIRHLLIDYPQLAQVVTAQFVRETYSVTELLEYARGYADREDSVFDKSGELALMERLKVIAGNQERNKKRIVEMIVNNAIEKAEKKSMRKLFQSKYDKRGCLILRDKDFEVG